MFWLGTLIFLGTYVVIASEKVHKSAAAMGGAMLMLLFVLPGVNHGNQAADISSGDNLPLETVAENQGTVALHLDSFAQNINFDVIFTLAGMMVLVNVLSETGLFQYVAIKSAKIAKGSPINTLLLLVFATAILSAFLDNVTTILLIAPVTLVVAAELEVPPIPFLLCETMASNIGGSATLIGDPPNLIIGSYAGLSFSAFMVNLSPFILVCLFFYMLALWFYYRKRMVVTIEKRARIMAFNEKEAITDKKKLIKGGSIMLLTLLGFLFHGMLHLEPSVVAMTGATCALISCSDNVDHALEKIEWGTLFFFMGLFILVKGAEEAGLMDELGKLLVYMNDWHPLAIILTIMWVGGLCAAIMNNVSFTAAAVIIIGQFIGTHEFFEVRLHEELLWWALALGVCLGGNGSAVGAAANMCTMGIAEKNGHKISFKDFFIYGIPVTIVTLIGASAYITLRFYQL
ncbi:ArsB/NhaD family transporter [Lentisphaera profundi]|uniref:ArsB/NhaD family transporter n=1 Tax=Lentisphaera profundi TaxID=1658616 RepID=A0ABY7VVG1_9BACT|nr:ArsB/NhaD family transporter [Lentisphaera profundi]WDE96729.1 ArsB/NhaD family transporter [Lentisphaera profundi]